MTTTLVGCHDNFKRCTRLSTYGIQCQADHDHTLLGLSRKIEKGQPPLRANVKYKRTRVRVMGSPGPGPGVSRGGWAVREGGTRWWPSRDLPPPRGRAVEGACHGLAMPGSRDGAARMTHDLGHPTELFELDLRVVSSWTTPNRPSLFKFSSLLVSSHRATVRQRRA